MAKSGLFLPALLIIVPVASASAQTVPAPGSTGLGGPVVAGVCMMSRDAIFANAKVAKAADVRLRQLAQDAQAEVDADRKPIAADITALRAATGLTAEQRAAREQALAVRLRPVEAKSEQRTQELQATRTKALERISTAVQPIVADMYRQRGCGLLLDRNGVIAGNMTNDLTPVVVQALDAKISTMTFDREALPKAPVPITTK